MSACIFHSVAKINLSTEVSLSAQIEKMDVFVLEDALSIWTNLGKHLLFVWLFVCNIKTGTRGTMRLYERSSVVRPDVVQRKIVRPDG